MNPPFRKALWKRAGVYAGVWGVIFGLFALQMQVSADFNWAQASRHTLVHWGPWILLAPAIFWLTQRFPIVPKWKWQAILLHITASGLAVILAEVLAFQIIGPALDTESPSVLPRAHPAPARIGTDAERHPPPHHHPPPHRLLNEEGRPPHNASQPPLRREERSKAERVLRGALARLPRWLPIYWLLVGMQSYRLMRKRLAEKDRQALELKHRLSQSQLDTLKWQLQPHFLFNTLNAIAGLIHEDPDKADTMVCQLSVLLRGVLEEHEAQQVSLKRELELLRAYLAIEQVRFDDRFQVVENIDPACLELLVPVLLLQPLVENAIRHGLAPRSGKGTLHLSASRNGKQLSLSIEDDGIGPESRDSTPTAKGFGIGLANAQARLEALFGPRGFQLQMGSRAKGGTRVTIDLPASPVALPPPHS